MQGVNKGDSGTARVTVLEEHLATAVGSGDVRVFSTPSLLALMEAAAVDCLRGKLDDGSTSVGTEVAELRHTNATPIGMTVTATATVESVSERTVVFSIVAHDDKEPVGQAKHTRVVLNRGRFEAKVASKAAAAAAARNH